MSTKTLKSYLYILWILFNAGCYFRCLRCINESKSVLGTYISAGKQRK